MSQAFVKSFESPSSKQVSTLALGALLAFGVATNANAEGGLAPMIGQDNCYAPEVARSVLAQEGMQPIHQGERVGNEHNRNLFYLNNAGYGYNIELPTANDASQNICVRAAYKNANVNSLDNDKVPAWAQGIQNIQEVYDKRSLRITLGAQTYSMSDGQEVPGKMILVTADANDLTSSDPYKTGAGVWSVDANGKSNLSFAMINFKVTEQMNAFLGQVKSSSK